MLQICPILRASPLLPPGKAEVFLMNEAISQADFEAVTTRLRIELTLLDDLVDCFMHRPVICPL